MSELLGQTVGKAVGGLITGIIGVIEKLLILLINTLVTTSGSDVLTPSIKHIENLFLISGTQTNILTYFQTILEILGVVIAFTILAFAIVKGVFRGITEYRDSLPSLAIRVGIALFLIGSVKYNFVSTVFDTATSYLTQVSSYEKGILTNSTVAAGASVAFTDDLWIIDDADSYYDESFVASNYGQDTTYNYKLVDPYGTKKKWLTTYSGGSESGYDYLNKDKEFVTSESDWVLGYEDSNGDIQEKKEVSKSYKNLAASEYAVESYCEETCFKIYYSSDGAYFTMYKTSAASDGEWTTDGTKWCYYNEFSNLKGKNRWDRIKTLDKKIKDGTLGKGSSGLIADENSLSNTFSSTEEWEKYQNYLTPLSGLIQIIGFLAICVTLIRLLFGVFQHYVTMVMLYYFFPFFSGFVASDSTQNIFRSYIRMFFSECILFVFNKIWVALSVFLIMGNTATLFNTLLILSFMTFGLSIDRLLKDAGLSTASTGGNLMSSMIAGAATASIALRGAAGAVGGAVGAYGKSANNLGAIRLGHKLQTGKDISKADAQQMATNSWINNTKRGGIGNENGISNNLVKALSDLTVSDENAIRSAQKQFAEFTPSEKKAYGEAMLGQLAPGIKEDLNKNGLSFKAESIGRDGALEGQLVDKNGNIIGSARVSKSPNQLKNGMKPTATLTATNEKLGETMYMNAYPYKGEGAAKASKHMEGKVGEGLSAKEIQSGVNLADFAQKDRGGKFIDSDRGNYSIRSENGGNSIYHTDKSGNETLLGRVSPDFGIEKTAGGKGKITTDTVEHAAKKEQSGFSTLLNSAQGYRVGEDGVISATFKEADGTLTSRNVVPLDNINNYEKSGSKRVDSHSLGTFYVSEPIPSKEDTAVSSSLGTGTTGGATDTVSVGGNTGGGTVGSNSSGTVGSNSGGASSTSTGSGRSNSYSTPFFQNPQNPKETQPLPDVSMEPLSFENNKSKKGNAPTLSSKPKGNK